MREASIRRTVTGTDSYAFFILKPFIANEGMTEAYERHMDFSFTKHTTTGVLNGEDLKFFYYDIGLDNLQGWPAIYDWDSVVKEFKDKLDIDSCPKDQMPNELTLNTIRFTVSNSKKSDNGSKAMAFFRHLRNAFAHYNVVRKGENYALIDSKGYETMRGLVNAEILKQFCFRFFDYREKITNDYEESNNQNIENK